MPDRVFCTQHHQILANVKTGRQSGSWLKHSTFKPLVSSEFLGICDIRFNEFPSHPIEDRSRSLLLSAWHQCPKNDGWKGEGFTEWDLVKAAKPRFPRHPSAFVPQWGYLDESDPAVMKNACDAASSHGIDAFIF